MVYLETPSAPFLDLTVLSGDSIQANFSAPLSDGGAAIHSYKLDWDTDPGTQEVQYITTATDIGSTKIGVWDSAFFDLTNVGAIKLRSLWEDGFDNEEKRDSILETLNDKFDRKLRLACTSSIWAYGGRVKKYKAEINVDAANS